MSNSSLTPDLLSLSDEEFEETLKSLSDEELLLASQQIADKFSQDPAAYPYITPEMNDDFLGVSETFETKVRESRIADENLAKATAEVNRSADRYLAALAELDKTNNTRGH